MQDPKQRQQLKPWTRLEDTGAREYKCILKSQTSPGARARAAELTRAAPPTRAAAASKPPRLPPWMQNRNKHELHDHGWVPNLYVKRVTEKGLEYN